MSTKPLVIIGSGVAGYTLAEEYRKLAPTSPLVMLTQNEGALYSKPGLSTVFHLQRSPEALATASAADMAARLNMEVHTHTEVTGIHPVNKEVYFEDRVLAYEHLVLALGAETRKLTYPGLDIFSVNELADYQKFRRALEGKTQVIIIGSGLVASEFANDLAVGAYSVEVVSQDAYPLEKFLPRVMGERLKTALENLGVRWHFRTNYKDFLKSINLKDTLVLSAIGIQPQLTLAKSAGIETRAGIVVNEYLETNLAHIYALGDCAEVQGTCHQYIHPAQLSAKALAKTLTGEKTAVVFALMRVKVKTPAYPIIFAGQIAPHSEAWVIHEDALGMEAILEEEGSYRGLILTGEHCKKFNELAKSLG